MSNDDLIWTQACIDQAAAEGWRLVFTVENGEKKGHYEIACMVDGDQLRSSDRQAQEFVVERARQIGAGAMHRMALQLVMQR